MCAGGEVPDFDSSVPGARCKPLVPGFDADAAHPAQVSGDDAHELPGPFSKVSDLANYYVKSLSEAFSECVPSTARATRASAC
jgi:hypothetical protein